MKRVLVVAGPTCSGKSALAMELARRVDGVVVNADAMQLYRDLRVVTARPSPADEAAVPHALYGVRPAAEAATVAWWRTQVLGVLDGSRVPVLCGGSGMYLQALLQGLAEVPPPGEAARTEARTLLAELGPAGLHARLAEIDPMTAGQLRPRDSQRIARAWEVWRGTGTGLAAWQARSPAPLPCRTLAFVLRPERGAVRAAIAARWEAMLDAGAVAEVAALLEQQLDPALPAMRAHGVPELAGYLRGEMGLGEASVRAVAATGRYVKRQETWLAHHTLAEEDRIFTINARIEDIKTFMERNMAAMSRFLAQAD